MNKNEARMRSELGGELLKRGKMTTQEALALLGVSESTVRRLFAKLEADGEAVRIYGGVRLPNLDNRYQYDRTLEQQRKAKTQIGKLAASLVSDNEFIYIDCGTTTIHLCEFLVERIRRGELSGITVVTNSFTHLEILTPYCRTILTGGTYYPERKSFAGALCETFLKQFFFQAAFLGADGFSFDVGFSTSGVETSHLSGVASTLTDRTVVLMDCTKIGRRSFVVYDGFENIHELVTDDKIAAEDLEALRLKGFTVHIAAE